jgi:hypothetical protein
MRGPASALVGSWKLVSFAVVDEVTLHEVHPWGPHPQGRMIFSSSGTMSATLTAGGREIPKIGDDAATAAALRSVVAYTGTYRIDGGAFTTHVDAAWTEAWVGTDQQRNFTVEDDRLIITTLPGPALAGGNTRHGVLIWQRERDVD